MRYSSEGYTNSTFLINMSKFDNHNSISVMKISGDSYYIQECTAVSKIRKLNGKKYVVYEINNSYFGGEDHISSMNSYFATNKALVKNGGHIGTVGKSEESTKSGITGFRCPPPL